MSPAGLASSSILQSMERAVEHERVRALRHEVVAVGRHAAQIRFVFGVLFAAGGCGVATAVGFLWFLATAKITLPVVLALAALAAGLGVVGYLATLPLAADFRGGQARHLRQEVTRLPDDQVRAALLDLREARSGDTRKLAETLLSELRASSPSEVTPAAAPASRGDEMTPARSL